MLFFSCGLLTLYTPLEVMHCLLMIRDAVIPAYFSGCSAALSISAMLVLIPELFWERDFTYTLGIRFVLQLEHSLSLLAREIRGRLSSKRAEPPSTKGHYSAFVLTRFNRILCY